MGVVSGIPLSYEFGTNWARFSEVVGNVIGPLIGYEVLTAFFAVRMAAGGPLAARFWWRLARHPTVAFYSAVGLFVVAFIGLVISTLPYLVPPTITLWQAAAAPESQAFILIGMSVLVPIILGYTVFVYYTFRGKVRPGEGYH